MIVVTGADGFIGSHVVEALLREGHPVRALAQYNSFGTAGWLDSIRPELRSSLSVTFGDIRDSFQMRELLRGASRVCHLASLIAIPYSYRAPHSYVETNVVGTLNLLQAAMDANVSRFVQLSTSEVYGTAQKVPIDESHPLVAQSPYAATKIAADQLALSFQLSFGLPVIVARPFNTYGPRQSLRAVIPTVIQQALGKSNEIRLGSLAPKRDLTFVEDTADALVRMILSDEGKGEVYNVSSNFEVSVGQIVDEVSNILGKKFTVTETDDRKRPESSEVMRLWGDNSKFRKKFDWSPRFAGVEGLKLGLQETVDWFIGSDQNDSGNAARYEGYDL